MNDGAGPDFLDGQPAKPGTLVPRHWILDLPPGPPKAVQVWARCFRPSPSFNVATSSPTTTGASGPDVAESSADAQRRSTADSTGLKGEAAREAELLERAWRTINSATTNVHGGVHDPGAGGPAPDAAGTDGGANGAPTNVRALLAGGMSAAVAVPASSKSKASLWCFSVGTSAPEIKLEGLEGERLSGLLWYRQRRGQS